MCNNRDILQKAEEQFSSARDKCNCKSAEEKKYLGSFTGALLINACTTKIFQAPFTKLVSSE